MAQSPHARRSVPVMRVVRPEETAVPIRCLRLEIPQTGEYCLNYALDPHGEHLGDVPEGAFLMPGVGFAWIERIGDLPL